MSLREEILIEVSQEREHQESLCRSGKFRATCATTGEDEMTDVECLAVFAEEFGEVAHEVTDGMPSPIGADQTELRKELLQCAAVCVAWIERIDFNMLPVRRRLRSRSPGSEAGQE